ncbi:hypothetical protein INR49_018494 [Caranx melampygus]|nr:hypothetical protein INR49_018494 [Caranx melampygus]
MVVYQQWSLVAIVRFTTVKRVWCPPWVYRSSPSTSPTAEHKYKLEKLICKKQKPIPLEDHLSQEDLDKVRRRTRDKENKASTLQKPPHQEKQLDCLMCRQSLLGIRRLPRPVHPADPTNEI